ncbi:MAG: deoxyuridine 5-triphosphate nucleotidohydrolase [Bacteroidota bacterium]|jgi:dUTP pyrophosphatase
MKCGEISGVLPVYATAGSAGMDITAALAEPMILEPGAIVMIPTGIAIALPQGFECQVRSRSGLAAKHGIFALNAPGTIDSDYRGEIKVILANSGKASYAIQPGERIAQLVIARYETVQWELVDSLDETERGTGGFGSTGTL